MSLPVLIYLIGSIFSAIIAIRMVLRDEKGDLTLMDLFLLLLIAVISGLGSWIFIVIIIFNKYKDKVIIKRRTDV